MAKKKPTSIVKLLETLRQKRDTDEYAAEFPQKIGPPEKQFSLIPSLKAGHVIKASPQLRDRFKFCGDWINACIGMTWLSISAMAQATRSRKVKQQIGGRREFWEGSAPQIFPSEKLSLFGIDLELGDEIYLIWPNSRGGEPKLIWYASQHYHEFRDLRELLLFMTGKRRAKPSPGWPR